MPERLTTPETERARRAGEHKVIGALERELDAIGHRHTVGEYRPGYCTNCPQNRIAAIPVTQCETCGRALCGLHVRERQFTDDKERARYFRLRSKIRRLQADLAQGRLITNR
jgi:hypothetical protein